MKNGNTLHDRNGVRNFLIKAHKILFFVLLLPAFCVWIYDLEFAQRSYELERQDKTEEEGGYTTTEFLDMMTMLAEANEMSTQGHAATIAKFDELSQPPGSILEIGYGLGRFSLQLGRKYPNANVTGIDSHILTYRSAIGHQQGLGDDAPQNVHFTYQNDPRLQEGDNSVDIITTTFVNHHIFPDEEFVSFLRKVSRVGRKAFIFNDFYRSSFCLAKYSFQTFSLRHLPLSILERGGGSIATLFRVRPGKELVLDGGILSMKRSFSQRDYVEMFEVAGYPDGSLQCTDTHSWLDVSSVCRLACIVDLTWAHNVDN